MAKRERIEQSGRRCGKTARAKQEAKRTGAKVITAEDVRVRMIRDSERDGVNGYASAESVAFRALLDDEGW